MNAEQLLEWVNNRIDFIQNRCLIFGMRGDGKSYQTFVHNALMQGRLEELKDIKRYIEEELL